ncbi:PAS domain-containing protein [Paracoccus beibuensis]|uniref:PAS domain-containing protein n=1 Tax=Paracoccus beibuensis TaxID=547602 RepID=UPI0022406A6D|nr:PAS domain-containing protein [Paracoccus beibuensis]
MPEAELPEALRAQIARSTVALSLATADAPDMPLCLANDAFFRLSGYDADAVHGRNCRFLRTPDTPPEQVREMTRFLHADDRDDGRFPVLNRTRQGRVFTNLVFMSKLRGQDGRVRFVIASQFDQSVADRATAQRQNDAALTRSVGDLRVAAAQFGLILSDTSALLARSVSTLARIAVRDE